MVERPDLPIFNIWQNFELTKGYLSMLLGNFSLLQTANYLKKSSHLVTLLIGDNYYKTLKWSSLTGIQKLINIFYFKQSRIQNMLNIIKIISLKIDFM